MGRMEQAIKTEMSRLGRKEARALVAPLKKQVVELKKEVAALKREAKEQARAIREIGTKLGMIYTPEAVLAGGGESPPDRTRLSPGLIKKLRKRLKISQADLAALVGVSIGAVRRWESGKGKPRPECRAKIVSLRRYGITEVKAMLGDTGGEKVEGGR